MSTDLEKKIDRLIDKIDGNMSSSGRTLPTREPGTSGVGGEVGALVGKLGTGLKTAIDITGDLAGKAIDNTATVGDATKAVSKVLDKFGAVGGIAGDALNGLSNILTESVDNWQKFSNYGLQFGGNAMALNEAIKKTGMTANEYESLLDKMTPALANFGQGLNRGAEMFGEASNALLNSPALQREVNLLGMKTKDVNEALITVVRGAGIVNTSNKDQMNALLNSAVQLGREMDMMAKLTGVSRKEQEKSIETMRNDERVRAQIVLMRKQNPNAEADIGKVQEQAKALDPAVQNLLMEAVAGKGIMSSEKVAEFQQVYGPEAARKIAEIGRNTTSQDARERANAIAETKDLIFMLAKEREKGAAMVATGAVSNQFSKFAYGDPRLDIIEKNLAEYRKTMTEDQAVAKAKSDADKLGRGLLLQDLKDAKTGKVIAKAGEEDPRMKTTQIITDTNTEIKRFGTALNEIINQLNTTIATQRDKNGKFVVASAANTVAGYNAAGGSRIKDFANIVKVEISSMGDIPKNWADAIGTASAEKIKALLEKREVGSKKATGSWFESGPKPILMGEGGKKEAVVPEDEIETFMRDMQFISSGMNPSSLPSARAPNLAGILKNIPAKVSAAQETTAATEERITGQESAQDKVVDKLDEISNVLAANLAELKNITTHTRDAASNTKDMGGYIG